MKLVTDGTLYDLLYAAYMFADYAAPAERIAEYLVANGVVPPNIRSDSMLADVWRDYQQILSDLGLMYSTTLTSNRLIKPTPCGMRLLDNRNAYREILTGQVLTFQYPNGAKRDYAPQQIDNDVLIRPAVLIWRVLVLLQQAGSFASINNLEIRNYLMRCIRHSDAHSCATAILEARAGGIQLAENIGSAYRNSTDWVLLLGNTLLFEAIKDRRRTGVRLSAYALANFEELDETIFRLEDEASFWNPSLMNETVAREWFGHYGAISVEMDLATDSEESDEEDNETKEGERESGFGTVGGTQLNKFDSARLNFKHENLNHLSNTIESAYDAGMVGNKHRLHDMMVIQIANVCAEKGAQVYDDPKSLDLFVQYKDTEYLIEVKTVTPHNYVKRLRYAIGQLFHYDFMLKQTLPNRRRVLAMPSILPKAPGFLPFLNQYMDMDVLSLTPTGDGQKLHCSSKHISSNFLFSTI